MIRSVAVFAGQCHPPKKEKFYVDLLIPVKTCPRWKLLKVFHFAKAANQFAIRQAHRLCCQVFLFEATKYHDPKYLLTNQQKAIELQ